MKADGTCVHANFGVHGQLWIDCHHGVNSAVHDGRSNLCACVSCITLPDAMYFAFATVPPKELSPLGEIRSQELM